MSCKLYVVYDPEQDAHLLNQVVCWCESSGGACEVVDWTPISEYGAVEQQMAQAMIRTCDAMVVLVGRNTCDAPNVQIEIEIGRRLRLPIFQLVSPEAVRRFVPGGGPAVAWSLNSLLKQIKTL